MHVKCTRTYGHCCRPLTSWQIDAATFRGQRDFEEIRGYVHLPYKAKALTANLHYVYHMYTYVGVYQRRVKRSQLVSHVCPYFCMGVLVWLLYPSYLAMKVP